MGLRVGGENIGFSGIGTRAPFFFNILIKNQQLISILFAILFAICGGIEGERAQGYPSPPCLRMLIGLPRAPMQYAILPHKLPANILTVFLRFRRLYDILSEEMEFAFEYSIIWKTAISSTDHDIAVSFDAIAHICQFAKHVTTYVITYVIGYVFSLLFYKYFYRKMPLLPPHMLSFVRPMIVTEITSQKLLSQKFAEFPAREEDEEVATSSKTATGASHAYQIGTGAFVPCFMGISADNAKNQRQKEKQKMIKVKKAISGAETSGLSDKVAAPTGTSQSLCI